ncbi:hypothetical protein PR048_028673 [Dryococelus australis]|uniref:Uncharacterized protein n=1 Tax=Dryococelus australis TaxID=614101 RepID=A0ABQ9GB77_9NEOP|nr:hypothetical protein PR048_028673 [Dryococelus australis]
MLLEHRHMQQPLKTILVLHYLDGIHTFGIVADGCGGQNKNKTMVGTVSSWLTKDTPPNAKKDDATVFVLGADNIPVHDWNTAVSQTAEEPGSWHFKFQPIKLVIIEERGST